MVGTLHVHHPVACGVGCLPRRTLDFCFALVAHSELAGRCCRGGDRGILIDCVSAAFLFLQIMLRNDGACRARQNP